MGLADGHPFAASFPETRSVSCGLPARIVTVFDSGPDRGRQEVSVAKGEMKGNKEAKKPKADKPKGSVSEYKKSQGKGGQAPISTGKK
jgi:hypothetical protein